ncbi:MAG: hypothetical protein AseanaTS_18140 [Candidatus Pelagadaptatus aseana]|uniref:PilZ domain-containing protein n=1 Tax=Candidatus Pelagadaptatus aseana TaxID=3120508 RepID=UPI0039B33556
MNPPNNNNKTEHRQEYRLKDSATVFIELIAESPEGDPAEIQISSSVDLSANGLQITTDQPLPVQSIYQAAIQFFDKRDRIPLTVQVRWCRFNEDSSNYHVGLAVLDDSDSRLGDWKMDISQRLMNIEN